MNRNVIRFAITAMLALVASVGQATEYYWINSGGGSYNTGANWDLSTPPGGLDNAHFTNNASYTVTWGATASNITAYFDAPGGLVTLNPGVNAWQLGGGLNVGQAAAAATTVRLDGGTYAVNSILLTNVTAGGDGRSYLQLKKGTLTTTGDSEIRMATNVSGNLCAYFIIGDQGVSGDVFTWRMLGGTTKIITPGPSGENQSGLYIGRFNQFGQGVVEADGPSTILTNITQVYVGDATFGNPANSLTITNGAKVYVNGVFWMGRSCANNRAVVDGAGSQLQAGYVYVGKNGANNSLTVTNGGRVVTSGFAIEEGGSFGRITVTGPGSSFYSVSAGNNGMGASGNCISNTLLIANGASFYHSGNMQFGKSANWYSPAQEIRVTGAGSSFTNTGSIAVEGSNTYFLVNDGGRAYWGGNGGIGDVNGRAVVTDTNSFLSWVGCNVGQSSSIVVSNGAALEVRVNPVQVGSGGSAGADRLASLTVTGPGSRFTSTNSYQFRVASVGNGQITVNDGGQLDTAEPASSWGCDIGFSAGRTGTVVVAGANSSVSYAGGPYGEVKVGVNGIGRLVITNQATFGFYSRSGLTVGNAAGAAGSSLLVSDGGLLDFRRWPDGSQFITVGNFAGNSFSNVGGIVQFPYNAPVVTPGAFGNVVFNGGTVSFRGIVNADIRCNQGGFTLDSATKVAWSGNNTFRLNTATNVAASQAYTFTDTLGGANFAGLDLMNGSLYRGGNVTIGSGGSLTVTGGVSAVSNDLTFVAGSTYRVQLGAPASASRVAVGSGNVTLGGAALEIQLTAAPEKDYPYVIIDNAGVNPVSGAFASRYVTASHGGTNYMLTVYTDRGTGNDVVAGWFTKGTVFFAR